MVPRSTTANDEADAANNGLPQQCAIRVSGIALHQLGGSHGSSGRPLLFWQLRELIRFGLREFILLTADEAGLETALPALLEHLPIRVTCRIARLGKHPGDGALSEVRPLLAARFLYCTGDAVFTGNLAALLQGAAANVITRFTTPQAVLRLIPRQSLPGHGAVAAAEVDVAVPPENFLGPDDPWEHRLRRPALFLDRDGVLNEDLGYVGSRERFHWIAGEQEAVRCATDAGWHVFIVTNQSGVARGFYNEAAVQDLLAWMIATLRGGGGNIDDVRYCPDHPAAAVAAYRQNSDWRKPGPGMLNDIVRCWDLTPSRCVMIGDQPSDQEAAAAAGMAFHMFSGGRLDELVRQIVR